MIVFSSVRLRLALVAFAAIAVSFTASATTPHPQKIVMVLSAPKGDVERSFEEYFARRGESVQTTEVYFSGRDNDQPALIAHLRQLAPDLIYTVDTATTLAVAGPLHAEPSRFITDVPVVFTSVSDPVAAGLVPELRHPGRNVTGVIPLAPMSIQLNALRDFGHPKSIGYLYGNQSLWLGVRDRLRDSCREQGLDLIDARVPETAQGELDIKALPALLADLKSRHVDFLYIGPETFTTASLQSAVMHAALEAHLPAFSTLESAVRDHGALFGVVSPPANIGRFAALKALRILSGAASASAEPIETLAQFSVMINMKTAQRLQVYPPLALLDAADVVR